MNAQQFIEEHGIELDSKVVDDNPSPFMGDNEMIHFQCTFKIKDEKAPGGYRFGSPVHYSMGLGHVERWAEENRRKIKAIRFISDRPTKRDFAAAFSPNRTLYTDGLRQTVIEAARKYMTPPLGGVLECFAMDCNSVEQVRCFEDWAENYGMDTDSRNAESCYKATCKQAAQLAQLMGESMFQDFLKIEEE